MLPYTSTGVKHDSQIPTTIWEEFHMHLGSTAWTQALCPLSNGPAWWRQCPSIQLLHQCLHLSTTSLKYANTPLHQGSSTHFIHCSWISYQKRVPNSYCGTQKTEFGMKNASMALCVTVSRSVMARLFETPRTGSCQAPLSMEFSRQVDCHFLLQGIFPIQGLNPGLLVSLVSQTVKNLPVMRETLIWSMAWEVPLEKGMATQSSRNVWRIPWTEEPDRL